MSDRFSVELACGALVENGRLLIGLRSPHRRAYPNCWDFIGGHVEPGETAEAAMVRELSEEIGVIATRYRLVTVVDLDDAVEKRVRLSLYTVTAWTGAPRLANHEHSELRWCTPAQASALPNLADQAYPELFVKMV